MSLSNAASAGILNQCLRGTTFSAAGTAYATLTTTPGGTEVSGTGYARVAVSYGAASAAQPSVATASEIDFGTVAGDWTPSTGIDVVDFYSASSGGTLLYTGTDTAISYATGNRAFVASGSTFQLGDTGSFSAAYLQDIVDWLVNGGSAPARARYLGLLNSGTELSGGNYARLDTDTLFPAASTADPAASAFASAVNFLGGSTTATFTGAYNQLGLFSAASGGSPLITVSVTSQTVASGDTVEVQPTVTLT